MNWSESGRPLPPFGFHAQDGWHFRREEDGTVAIILTTPDGESVVEWGTLDNGSWASAVASVSKRGETAETFRAADLFHMGGGDD